MALILPFQPDIFLTLGTDSDTVFGRDFRTITGASLAVRDRPTNDMRGLMGIYDRA